MSSTILGIIASSGGAAASTSSYESIASATGTGSSGVITFSSIPATYKHLQIRGIAKDTYAGTFELPTRVRFNSDTGNNYTQHNLQGNGASATAQGEATGTNAFFKFRGSNLSTDATYANMNANVNLILTCGSIIAPLLILRLYQL